MKIFFLLGLLFSFNAFSFEVCDFRDTTDLFHELKKTGIKPSKVSKNIKRFTFIEKQIIHRTVTQRDWFSGANREEALSIFSEMGNVRHYTINEKEYALALYYPQGVEYGAFYELKNTTFKLVAEIIDGHIICKSYN